MAVAVAESLMTDGGKQQGQVLRVVKTNAAEEQSIHTATARMIFANNVPFAVLKSKQWRSLMSTCRPGLRPLTVDQLVKVHLPREYARQREAMVQQLKGGLLTLSVDGWTGPQNTSVLGIALGQVCAPTTSPSLLPDPPTVCRNLPTSWTPMARPTLLNTF